jgi:hypothetical protein
MEEKMWKSKIHVKEAEEILISSTEKAAWDVCNLTV